ncbi:glycosyltransferase family 61 protein [Pseudomonas sp. QD4]|uniref:glycosyltransferase family 61 protein n=1 Tax=Pseudomonas sp. QD4 TaxID=3368618 RepID=UPI003BA2187B
MRNQNIFLRLKPYLLKIYWALYHFRQNIRSILKVVYHSYLARFALFRSTLAHIRKTKTWLLKVKAAVQLKLYAKRYSLVSHSAFKQAHDIISIPFNEGGTISIKGPAFLGRYDFSPIGDKTINLCQPKLETLKLQNVTLMGGTNYILAQGFVIHPDQYDPNRDICPAELNGIARVNPREHSIFIVFEGKRVVEKAISLLGCCTGNYAHWLTETLPKVLIVDGIADFDDYPLLIDSWIHPNFIDSINLICKIRRPLIRVNRWEAVHVGSLVEVSPTAYVPPEYRSFIETKQLRDPDPSDFPFSAVALNLLRDTAHRAMDIEPTAGDVKLFLFRPRESCGNTRLVKNIVEIEQIVRSYGYIFLDPAKLSFNEQAAVFSTASHVVSPLGAAMANLIFTPPGCKVLGLSPYYDNANYYYFSNFMGALGHELNYVLGHQTSEIGHPFNREYAIDLDALKFALESISHYGR